MTLERDARDDRLVGAAAVEDEAQTLAGARREVLGRALGKDERFGNVGFRVGEHIADVADLGDAALVDDGHALTDLLDDAHLVRDDDDRHAERLVDLLEQTEDRLRGVRVEGAGGLVAQEVFRPRRQGAGDGHALLLTAGELRGIGLRAVGQSDELEQLLGARLRLVALDARDLEREADVAQHRALLEQVEALEDHADVLPRLEQIASAELRHVAPVDAHRAGGRPFEEIDAAHERALAGTAQADDAEDLPVLDAQVHIPQRVDVAGRRGVGLVEMFDFDHGGFSLAE